MNSQLSITKKIQRIVGATPDGIYGPETAEKMLEYSRACAKAMRGVAADEQPEFDARTEGELRELLPEAQKVFRPFIAEAKRVAKEMGCYYTAISSYRSFSDQDALYAQGRGKPGAIRTRARGGWSWHNYRVALDFGVFQGRRYLDNDEPELAAKVHRRIGALAAQYGIKWGGNWKWQDIPHYQVDLGMSLTEARELHNQGKEVMS